MCLLSRYGVGASVKKNWDPGVVQGMSFNRGGKKEGKRIGPFVFGPELAIAKMPADKPSAYCFFLVSYIYGLPAPVNLSSG